MTKPSTKRESPNSVKLMAHMWPSPERGPKIEYVCVEELTPDPGNPRKHSREQVRAIAKSIETFGFNAPILVDKANRIIAGHGKLEAAKICGCPQVPTLRLDHLSAAQARAYMLADNKLTDRSSWDDGVLALRLKELSNLSLDFGIEATGFELPEIDFRIPSLDDADVADRADEFEPAVGPAVSRVGDLWLLSKHRLLCGSSLDGASYRTLFGEDKASAVFADPPYNVKVDGHVCGSGAVRHREFAMASGEMTVEAFTAFLHNVFDLIAQHTVPGGLIYSCMDWRHIVEITTAALGSKFDLLNLCVWVKSNGGMGSLYRSQHELIFVFRSGEAPHRNNVQLGRFGRNRTNVWNYPGANSFPRKGRTSGLGYHPTSKPIAMVADAIRDATDRQDIVFDPFSGGGTSILAAERTDRRGFGIEIDPLYVDTTIKRWEALTGRQAQHASGKSYAEIRAERQAIA